MRHKLGCVFRWLSSLKPCNSEAHLIIVMNSFFKGDVASQRFFIGNLIAINFDHDVNEKLILFD